MTTDTTTPLPDAGDEPEPEPPPLDGPLVEIGDNQAHLTVDAEALRALAARTLRLEGLDRASVSIALVDDATIHAVNRRHLDHDWPTDVITFVLSDEDDDHLAAELVVSAEMAATTAREAGVDPRDELLLYVVHGLLHLAGHDDTTPDAAAAMRRREAEVLAALGVANTFGAVAVGPADGASGPSHDDGRGVAS